MLGSSRTSMQLLNEAVDAAFNDPELGQAGSDLLSVTDLLTHEKSLRQTLADGGLAEADRKAVLQRIVGERISPLALALATKAVGLRWSNDRDLVDGLELGGVSALIGQAEKSGTADRVAEELFRFGRVVDANGDLQLTLSSPGTSTEAKQAIVSELLTDRADSATLRIASFVVTHLRGRRIDQALEEMVELAAVRRGEIAATVRVAAPMEPQQTERLAAALRNIYGQPVQLSIEIDPDLIGGVAVQVGDELIDGSLAYKLNQARRRLAG